MTGFPSETAINEALDKIFARPEFHSLIQELLARIYDWLGVLFSGFNIGNFNLMPLFVVVIFSMLLIFCIVLLARGALHLGSLHKSQAAINEEAQKDYWLISMGLAEKGAFDKAIVFLFIWYLQHLAEGNFIKMEKGKTNLQYELELRQNAYSMLDRFRTFKMVFAAVRFGGHSIDRDVFEGWRSFCLETCKKGATI